MTFSALADPTRRAILARLASGETTVTELARPFEMSLPAVSKHLKVLERAGLSRAARRRSGGPAGSRPGRSRRWRTGWTNIASSGKRASIAWRSTSGNLSQQRRKSVPVEKK